MAMECFSQPNFRYLTNFEVNIFLQLSTNPTLAVGTVAVAAALYYIYTNNYEKTRCLIDVNNQTKVLPGNVRIIIYLLILSWKVRASS